MAQRRAAGSDRRIQYRLEAELEEAIRERNTARGMAGSLASQLTESRRNEADLEAALTLAQARIAEAEEHIRSLEGRSDDGPGAGA